MTIREPVVSELGPLHVSYDCVLGVLLGLFTVGVCGGVNLTFACS